MSSVAFVIAVLFAVGALASWIAGAVFYLRALRASAQRARTPWLAVAFWPFALKRLAGAGSEHASNLNKSIVAILACATLAVTAASVASNLHRFGK